MTQTDALPGYLFVVPWSFHLKGGVNQVVLNLAGEMQRAGVMRPVVLIDDWDSPTPVWDTYGDLVTVRWRLRMPGTDVGLRQRLLYSLWMRKFKVSFSRFCKEQGIAAINIHYPGRNVFTLQQVLRLNGLDIPLLISFHGTDLNVLRRRGAKELRRWLNLMQSITAVVCCSHALGQQVKDVLGSPGNLVVIHSGVHYSAFRSQAETTPRPHARNILSVGRFDHVKGQDVLIRAFAAIAADHPDANLVLVGANGPLLPTLRDLCKSEGIASRVSFHTDVNHDLIAPHFRQASLFVLPSRSEAFGLVLLEAGCFGLPVIASKVGGIPEIIEDGVLGRLVPPDDPARLASAMKAILDDPASGHTLGSALQRRVEQSFTWARTHDQYVALAGH